MRLALAQINSVVGDLDGNASRVVEWLERARDANADVVLFPELVVTGYPPEDLLLRPGFIRAARRAVDGIAKATRGITVLVGAPHLDADLYNACFVLADGEIRSVYRKRFLPNYGVFDEERYFAAGRELVMLRLGEALEDQLPVPVEIADDRVDLGQCEPHGFSLAVYASQSKTKRLRSNGVGRTASPRGRHRRDRTCGRARTRCRGLASCVPAGSGDAAAS